MSKIIPCHGLILVEMDEGDQSGNWGVVQALAPGRVSPTDSSWPPVGTRVLLKPDPNRLRRQIVPGVSPKQVLVALEEIVARVGA